MKINLLSARNDICFHVTDLRARQDLCDDVPVPLHACSRLPDAGQHPKNSDLETLTKSKFPVVSQVSMSTKLIPTELYCGIPQSMPVWKWSAAVVM